MALPSTRDELSFQERVFVAIEKKGAGSQTNFATNLNEIGFENGNKDFDQEALMNGGFHRTRTVEEPSTFSGEAFIGGPQTDTGDTTTPEGFAEYFYEAEGPDHAESDGIYQYHNGTLERSRFRITILWTTDSNVTSATDSVASGEKAFRKVIRDVNLIDYNENFDDMETKAEFEFKTTARTVTADPNVGEWGQDGTGTVGLDALDPYADGTNVLKDGAASGE